MKQFACILAFLIYTASCPDAAELTVVYTGNSNGKLMFCNCPNDPYGGLSERVTLIKDLREKEDEFLLVDAGSMVGLFGDYDLKASCVFRMMNMMGYDVAAAGRNEVYRGVGTILKTVGEAKFPIVSVSFTGLATMKPVFRPFAILTVGDVTAAVTSVSDSSTFLHVKPRENDFGLRPPDEALAGVIADMDEAADFVIVLSQSEPDVNARLLRDFPAVDLIVEAYGNSMYDPPVSTSDGIIVSTGTYGENVGLVTLEKSAGNVRLTRSRIIPVENIPEDKKAHRIVIEYYRNRK